VVRTQVVAGSPGEELDMVLSGVAASYKLRTRREHKVTEILVKRSV
jgi:hypothetical protein